MDKAWNPRDRDAFLIQDLQTGRISFQVVVGSGTEEDEYICSISKAVKI